MITPTPTTKATHTALDACGVYIVEASGWIKRILRQLTPGRQEHRHNFPLRIKPYPSRQVFKGICTNLSWSPDGTNLAFEWNRPGNAQDLVILLNFDRKGKPHGQLLHENLASPCWLDNSMLAAVRPRSWHLQKATHRFNYRDQLFLLPVGGELSSSRYQLKRYGDQLFQISTDKDMHRLRLAIPTPLFDRLEFNRDEMEFVFMVDGYRKLQADSKRPHQLCYGSLTVLPSPKCGIQRIKPHMIFNASRLMRRRLCQRDRIICNLKQSGESNLVAKHLLPISRNHVVCWLRIWSLQTNSLVSASLPRVGKLKHGLPSEAFFVTSDKSGSTTTAYFQTPDEELDLIQTGELCSSVTTVPPKRRIFYVEGTELLAVNV